MGCAVEEYAAAGQGECKDMAIPRYTKEPRKSQEFLRDFLGYLGMGKGLGTLFPTTKTLPHAPQ